MSSNPAAPINLVKEPVHDHQQNDDSQESGRGLEIERRHIVAERADDAHRDKPGDQAGDKSEACAERDRLAMHAFGPRHTRGDGSEDENAFQSLSEDENADIEERDCRARVRARRIRRTVCRDPLPNQHRGHKKRGNDNADAQSRLHFALGAYHRATVTAVD